MPPLSPIMLSVRTREVLRPQGDEPRQIVEVLHGDKVIGQLPVSRVEYEMLPENLGRIRIDLYVKNGTVEST